MTEDVDVMEACCCCLRRAPDKDLKTPHKPGGSVESYVDMIRECFNIQIVGGTKVCGICKMCVRRLRDASSFKLQVQTCQEELKAHLDTIIQKDEHIAIKSEIMDESETSGEMLDDEWLVKVEVKEETSMGQVKAEVLSEHIEDEEDKPNANQTSLAARKKIPGKAGLNTEEETTANNKLFTCDICNKQFFKRRYLTVHKHIHTSKFSCDICPKQFARLAHLTQHIRVHTGDKPFSCDQCDKKFAQHGQLKLHTRVHARSKSSSYDIPDKTFSCDICHKTLSRASHLTNHKRLHTGEKPFICNTCGKQFAQKTNLILHIRIHTDEQPYSCEKCNRTFKHYSSFSRHKITHTGVNAYTCDLCSTQFRHKRSLIPHFRRHQREKKTRSN